MNPRTLDIIAYTIIALIVVVFCYGIFNKGKEHHPQQPQTEMRVRGNDTIYIIHFISTLDDW